ncbi:E3 ubiquitin-protein ligase RNF186 [Discoglossus pictus]
MTRKENKRSRSHIHVEHNRRLMENQMDSRMEGSEGGSSDMDPAITEQSSKEEVTEQGSKEEMNNCSLRPSVVDPSKDATSAPALMEPEYSNFQQEPSINMGDQDTLQPSMDKQDMETSCMSSLTEMDCAVCFNKYDIYRVPKLLSCKHTFCAVCLKLLVRHEDSTWRIGCPICRATTVVFGGLICTLENEESLMSRLERPEFKTSTEIPGKLSRSTDNEESNGNLKMAAKRLVALLLILLILLIIVLQFVYSGIMKWVLGFILGVVVIVTVLLCFNPSCKIHFSRTSSNPQKDNYIISAV